ncbi:DUF3828 domain-containing protein [Brevundimonas sp.]|uniref:DUF3828 domain-containing protein n=1 Tax=Brevundimonas sp. TaxID=1871086 RepID=UPI00289B45E9|nr:DUF3828 domain-containing protein [Brevundimonas sp.]
MRVQAIMTAAILALTAAACSPAEEKAHAPAEAPLIGRAAVYAAGETDAEAFARALYAAPLSATPDDPAAATVSPGRDPLYSRTMNALIGVDFREAQSRDEVPYLNYDPVCACQDADGFALTALKMTPDSDKAATAEVTFTNHGQTHQQTLKLAKEGPMWRIADIIDAKGKSLHDTLMAIAEKSGA